MNRELVKKLRNNPTARTAREVIVNLGRVRENPYSIINTLMSEFEMRDVFDVGANIGQFGIDLRRKGYRGTINSFEPVKSIYDQLCKNVTRFQPWSAWNLAFGEIESSRTINVSGNNGLSTSFLSMRKLHLENFPESSYVRTEIVQISTVDIQIAKLKIDPRKLLLKLDVQGFESAVIRGASEFFQVIPFCFLLFNWISCTII